MIRVQKETFDVGAEIARLTEGRTDIGGVASFVGMVRDFVYSEADAGGKAPKKGTQAPVAAMTLEHYPGMTEKMLDRIEAEANRRWTLDASLIIHRYGRMEPGEPIVLVACASAHRRDALEACAFLIDWLKTKAPFWKLEETGEGEKWVAARDSDDAAAERWETD